MVLHVGLIASGCPAASGGQRLRRGCAPADAQTPGPMSSQRIVSMSAGRASRSHGERRTDSSPAPLPPRPREAESLTGLMRKQRTEATREMHLSLSRRRQSMLAESVQRAVVGCNSGRNPSCGASSEWWSKTRALSSKRFSVFRIGQTSRTSRGSSSRRKRRP